MEITVEDFIYYLVHNVQENDSVTLDEITNRDSSPYKTASRSRQNCRS